MLFSHIQFIYKLNISDPIINSIENGFPISRNLFSFRTNVEMIVSSGFSNGKRPHRAIAIGIGFGMELWLWPISLSLPNTPKSPKTMGLAVLKHPKTTNETSEKHDTHLTLHLHLHWPKTIYGSGCSISTVIWKLKTPNQTQICI